MKTNWHLSEISEWTSAGSHISIPSIQRGLVWKPAQVELLWDSILRGFPIGCFILNEIGNDYTLLDGQQRWNAIALGLGKIKDARAVVWLDVAPEKIDEHKWGKQSDSTRKFYARVTTVAHPWGYYTDDGCTRLDSEKKRLAIKEFGFENREVCVQPVSLSESYPAVSGYPLPLAWLMEVAMHCDEDYVFANEVIQKIKDNHSLKLKVCPDAISINDRLRKIFITLKKAVTEYFVPSVYVSSVIARGREMGGISGGESKEDIEILFERIGTGGTPITQAELMYSAIKAYWPKDLRDENDRLASLYMPPVTLVLLASRLALARKDSNLPGNLTVEKIRGIAKDKKDEFKSIYALYDKRAEKSELESILKMVNDWLTYDETPTVLSTSIARNSPDVYLLLMVLAQMHLKIGYDDYSIKIFRAVAFYIHWFVDKKAKSLIVNNLYGALIKNPEVMTWTFAVQQEFLNQYTLGNDIPLISVASFRELFGPSGKVGTVRTWRTWSDGRVNQFWWPLWFNVCANREMLIYAQRKYFNRKFPMYDPAKSDMWAEYNRPWDYDHIIPKDWIYQYRSRKMSFSDYCCDWLDTNGNIAAIPFEINRSKSDRPDWDEYKENKNDLLIDDEIGEYGKIFNSKLRDDGVQATQFAQKTFERQCRIYEQLYCLLEPIDISAAHRGTEIPDEVDTGIWKRMRMLQTINDAINGNIYYIWKEIEYPISGKPNWLWASEWMSVGVVTENGYYVALVVHVSPQTHEMDGDFEIGLRRTPGTAELRPINNPSKIEDLKKLAGNLDCKDCEYCGDESPWWYVWGVLASDTFVEDCISKILDIAHSVEEIG